MDDNNAGGNQQSDEIMNNLDHILGDQAGSSQNESSQDQGNVVSGPDDNSQRPGFNSVASRSPSSNSSDQPPPPPASDNDSGVAQDGRKTQYFCLQKSFLAYIQTEEESEMGIGRGP